MYTTLYPLVRLSERIFGWKFPVLFKYSFAVVILFLLMLFFLYFFFFFLIFRKKNVIATLSVLSSVGELYI